MDASFTELFKQFNEKVLELDNAKDILNTAWYTYGSKNELLNNGVITKEGGFTSESSILDGTLNGSRLPWQVNMDARVDKYFDLEWGTENKKRASLNVYFQILNVLNTLNINSVYGATGNADDDGYLNDPASQAGIASVNNEAAFRELYRLKVNNPANFMLPRRIRVGVLLNF